MEETTAVAVGTMVFEATEVGTSLFSFVVDLVTSNPLLSVVFVLGTLIPVGFGLFAKAKRTAKR